MRTYIQAKAMARTLRDTLAARKIPLTHSECLEIVSRQFGFAEWNMLSSKIALETGARKPPPLLPGIAFQPAIPVIRIASAPQARKFYVDFLGFEIDWGWEGDQLEAATYAQISCSGVTLHLSEQPGSNSSGSSLFIRTSGLDRLYERLSGRDRGLAQIEIYSTDDDRREMRVTDPFGNTLRFSENNPSGRVGHGK